VAYHPADVLSCESGPGALSGVQALARVMIDQRRADRRRGWHTAGLVSGYRGSPLAGLDLIIERAADLFSAHDIRFIPGVNEELGATVVYGSQLAPQLPDPRFEGVFGMWYGKAPGVDRAGDALKHGTWMGTTPRGGVLAVAGDDPANKSSSLPSNSTMALADAFMPVLAPGSVADILRLGRYGLEMSRFTGSWTGFTVVTNVADAYEVAELGGPLEVVTPEFEWDGRPWRPHYYPGVTIAEATALEREVLEGRPAAAVAFAAANGLDQVIGTGAARIGIIASGHVYTELRTALDRLGLDAAALARRGLRLLRLGLVHPLDPARMREFARGLTEIIVVEDKRAFIETHVKDVLYGTAGAPAVYGKRGPDGTPLIPVTGALDADRLIGALGPLLAERIGREHLDLPRPADSADPAGSAGRRALPLVALQRTPYFCSGCPHNTSTKPPDGALIGSGIGCHALTTLMGRSIGFTQMGAEGTSWVGAAPFTGTSHFFQNIGDGTYFHSGTLALRQAVAAGTDITFKILYNRAVAMTGGQLADGGAGPVELTWQLHGEGVARTVIVADDPGKYRPGKYGRRPRWAPGVTVHHRDELERVQDELARVPGVTVLVYDQMCAAEARRKRKRGELPDPVRRIYINEAVCEGCGDCGAKSNCLSVEPVDTDHGRKTRIDQTSCNKDYSCLSGDCPSFLVIEPGADRPAEPLELPEAPEPARRPAAATIVMAGIGGTGVVTVNRVLATAALLDGLHAGGLDQTGMSQKAGAVVSHLAITRAEEVPGGPVGAGQADAYLAFDLLAAAGGPALACCSPARTGAVASTGEVPVGRQVADPDAPPSSYESLLESVRERTREMFTLDALALAGRLFGTTTQANFVVVGAAYQQGLLPVSAAAIEKAIELNGAAVAATTAAFRAGRRAVAEPAWLAGLTAAQPAAGPALARLLHSWARDLVAYQNPAYARRYLAAVEAVRAAEATVTEGTDLAAAVARNLFKLMAYKDEYEVARLHLDPAMRRGVAERFGEGARVGYALHPPILRALGLKKKIVLADGIARPSFRALRAMRGLRGTPADPFGHTKTRRLERALIEEYLEVVDRLIAGLTAGNHDLAVEIAGLPDLVRGYEEVKLAGVERYRARLAEILPRYPARHLVGTDAAGTTGTAGA
jgi:indolepyruvate ferredoxin oxidoreductase